LALLTIFEFIASKCWTVHGTHSDRYFLMIKAKLVLECSEDELRKTTVKRGNSSQIKNLKIATCKGRRFRLLLTKVLALLKKIRNGCFKLFKFVVHFLKSLFCFCQESKISPLKMHHNAINAFLNGKWQLFLNYLNICLSVYHLCTIEHFEAINLNFL